MTFAQKGTYGSCAKKTLKTLHNQPSQTTLVSNPRTSIQAPHFVASVLNTGNRYRNC